MVDPRRQASPPVITVLTALAVFGAACGACVGQKPQPDAEASAPLEAQAQNPAPAEAEAAAAETDAAKTAAAPEPAPEPEGGIGPLRDEEREILHAEIEDEELGEWEVHYIKSNEGRHDVWFPYVADLGGAFIGVGSDQNYTVLAAQKAEYALLLDIDPRIADLHHVYEVLIEASEDPATLHARWHADNKDESIALLEEAFADVDAAKKKRYLREYRAARETVWRHLRHVIKRDRDGQNTSWLSNPEMYAHVRTMFLNDRIRVQPGDLTGPKTLRAFGAVVEKLGTKVRVLYLSNAEEYFTYTSDYRENVRSLPADDKSITLRTIYNKEWEHADSLWNYQVQPLQDFQARLEQKKNGGRNAMIRYADREDGVLERTTDVKGLSRIAMTAPGAQ